MSLGRERYILPLQTTTSDLCVASTPTLLWSYAKGNPVCDWSTCRSWHG